MLGLLNCRKLLVDDGNTTEDVVHDDLLPSPTSHLVLVADLPQLVHFLCHQHFFRELRDPLFVVLLFFVTAFTFPFVFFIFLIFHLGFTAIFRHFCVRIALCCWCLCSHKPIAENVLCLPRRTSSPRLLHPDVATCNQSSMSCSPPTLCREFTFQCIPQTTDLMGWN